MNLNGEIPENYARWHTSSSEPSKLPSIQQGDTNAANAPLRGSKRVFDVAISLHSNVCGVNKYAVIVTNEHYNEADKEHYDRTTRIPVVVTDNYEYAQHMAALWCDFLGIEQKYKYIE